MKFRFNFENEDIGNKILKKLGMKPRKNDLKEWRSFVKVIKNSEKKVEIGVVWKNILNQENFTLIDS